jgi:hypothetical protein
MLNDLGFTIKDGKLGGHKTYYHPAIKEFHGSNYNCGHGRDPIVKKAYIRNILKVLDIYEADIRNFLRGQNND